MGVRVGVDVWVGLVWMCGWVGCGCVGGFGGCESQWFGFGLMWMSGVGVRGRMSGRMR